MHKNEVIDDKTNFFTVGGNLQEDAPSYVVRQADIEMYRELKAGKLCYVLTSRQMGKSSLGARVLARLKQEGVAGAMFELVAIGRNVTVEQWYYGLLDKIGVLLDRNHSLGMRQALSDFWDSNTGLGPLQRCIQALREVVLRAWPGHVVIVLDEIETVRDLPFSTDEFLTAIRELYNSRDQDPELRRLTFCLIGSATPSDLIKDTRITPFNVGQRIELHDFTEAEARNLAVGLNRGAQGNALLKRIFYWTDGQPYLTQKLCGEVAKDPTIVDSDGVDRLCEKLFLSPGAEERDNNLIFVRDRILDNEDRAGLLHLYAQIHKQKPVHSPPIKRFFRNLLDLYSVQPHQPVRDDDADPLLDILKLSGITKVDNGFLRVRNRIYYKLFDVNWIKKSMPGAELERERAAYRLGLLRAAAAAVVLILAMGGFTFGYMMRSQSQQAMKEKREAVTERDALQNQVIVLKSAAADLISSNEEASAQLKQLKMEKGVIENQIDNFREQQQQAEQQKILAEQQLREAQNHIKDAAIHLVEAERALTIAKDEARRVNEDVVKAKELAEKELARQKLELGRLEMAGGTKEEKENALQDLIPAYKLAPNNPYLRFMLARAFPEFAANSVTLGKSPTMSEGYSGITSASMSANTLSPYIVTVSSDSMSSVWDMNGELKCSGFGRVDKAVFSPKGDLIVTATKVDESGGKTEIKRWDFSSEKCTLSSTVQLPTIVSDIAFDNNGHFVVAGKDNMVRIFDVATNRQETLDALAPVTSVVFSPDGQFIAATVPDSIKIWEVKTKKLLKPIPFERPQSPDAPPPIFKFSSTNKSQAAVIIGDQNIFYQDFSAGVVVKDDNPFIPMPPPASFISFSPNDGELVFVDKAASDSIAGIYNIRTGDTVYTQKPHQGRINYVAYNPDGSLIVTASADGTARIWDARSGFLLATLSEGVGEEDIRSADFTPDGEKIITRSNFGVKIWDLADFKLPYTLQEQRKPPGTIFEDNGTPDGIKVATFSRDGNRIFTASDAGLAIIWDTTSKPTKESFDGMLSTLINQAELNRDGSQLIISTDSGISIWHRDKNNVWRLSPLRGQKNIIHACFNPEDGTQIATAYADGSWSLWNLSNNEWVEQPYDWLRPSPLVERENETRTPVFVKEGTPLLFSPEGTYILTIRVYKPSTDTVVELWSIKEHKLVKQYNYKDVQSATFSAQEDRIVLWGADKLMVFKTDFTLGDVLNAPPLLVSSMNQKVGVVAFSEDGEKIVATAGRLAKVFKKEATNDEDEKWKQVSSLGEHTGEITSAFFICNPDDLSQKKCADADFIVTSSKDKTIKIWDSKCGKLLTTLSGHAGEIRSATFNLSKFCILTASADGTAKIWDINDIRPDASKLESNVNRWKPREGASLCADRKAEKTK
jgi:WD40 repeat protein